MKVKKIYFVAVSALTLMFTSCKEDNEEYDVAGMTDALVQRFELADNDSVADNLRDVFFAINQYGSIFDDSNQFKPVVKDSLVGQIFNADSLPFGTKFTKLQANITTTSSDKIFIYTTPKDSTQFNAGDSINFTNPVIMEVIAADRTTKKFYEVKVNVHQQLPDSINWTRRIQDPITMPSGDFVAQRALPINGQVVWLLQTSTGNFAYTSAATDLNTWQGGAVATSTALDFASVAVFKDELYALSVDKKKIMKSTNGQDWGEVAQNNFVNLIGAYTPKDSRHELIALVNDGGQTKFAYSDDASTWRMGEVVPAEFPVEGYSNAQQYFSGTSQRLSIVGGELANGELISSFWNYERTSFSGVESDTWQIFPQSKPGFKDATLFPYTDQRAALDLKTSQDLFWMVIGGIDADNKAVGTIYLTPNRGVGLFEAPTSYQLPASRFIGQSRFAVYVGADLNINLMGGVTQSGTIMNLIEKGRLNKVAFKPLR